MKPGLDIIKLLELLHKDFKHHDKYFKGATLKGQQDKSTEKIWKKNNELHGNVTKKTHIYKQFL